ncbi:c-type cytochrome [Phormidium sp. CLA17]|uniref:cytochrome c6 PetJ n=1 Tax=Leptolyngbya sp. Cla-17 TaxID=2803751 RepID=UPI001492E14D|nr:c-type cytochrome [Leptolyngbya sp. Cla-17]MBM0741477.1 c-type cytochrome [Leptolyngbya sp. Cla-17]
MRKLLSILFAAISVFTLAIARPALADASTETLAQGAKVFSANCAACHMNGNNVVSANKNLKSAALEKYAMNSAEAIITQVTNGKNAMPAFKGRLNDEQIKAVAAYVLDQSANDWKA